MCMYVCMYIYIYMQGELADYYIKLCLNIF